MYNDLNTAVETLRKGGIILYPTDTIWGIGCDATNREAVARIYSIKKRQDEKSMLVLLDDAKKLPDYAEVPDIAWDLIELSDKPLTLIYPDAQNLADNLIAEDGSIGIRIVKDDFCRQMIRLFGKPVVSTSANISGMPWPPGFGNIDPVILGAVDYVVKHRQNEKLNARPSGIIKLGKGSEIRIIRE